jgi:hypothetical protein
MVVYRQGWAWFRGSIVVKSLRNHAVGSPRKGEPQERPRQLADPELQLLQLLRRADHSCPRPLLRLS